MRCRPPLLFACATFLVAASLVGQDEGFETARRLLREIEVTTESVVRPDPERLLQLGREGSQLSESARQRLGDALGELEEALLEVAFPRPLPEPDPEAGGDPATVRARITHASLERPFPSIRAIWSARRLIELGPEPDLDSVLEQLGTGEFALRRAALEVFERDPELAGRAAVQLAETMQGRSGDWVQFSDPGVEITEETMKDLVVKIPLPGPRGGEGLVRRAAARSLVSIDPASGYRKQALAYLLDHGSASDRIVALRALGLDGTADRLLRYRVIRLLDARSGSDDELLAATLALASLGVPPEDEWPPERATLRRWMRSGRSTTEQRQMARELLSWTGPTDAQVRPALEALAEDPDRPRAARAAERVLRMLGH